MSARLTLYCAAIWLAAAPAPAAAELLRYVDASGTAHFVDDPDLVPPQYRDQLQAGEGRTIQIQPALAEPPKSRPAPTPPGPASPGEPTLHRSFSLARLSFEGGQPEPGPWIGSTEVAPRPSVHVVVAATWCPHCVTFFRQIAADPRLREAIDVIAFFDDEGEKQDRLLTHPERVAELGLDFHLVQRADFDGVVNGFPTLLECDATGCKAQSREKFLERFRSP